MPYLTAEELNTHLYGEVVSEIERDEDQTPLLNEAIEAAIGEVRSFLAAYDRDAIFNATGSARHKTVLMYTKDVAVWHFIQLANPNIEMATRQVRYEKATKWLEKVQSGKATPELPHLQADVEETGSTFVKIGSNPKRNNHF